MLFLKAAYGEPGAICGADGAGSEGRPGAHSTLHGVVFAILCPGQRPTAHIVSKTRVSALRGFAPRPGYEMLRGGRGCSVLQVERGLRRGESVKP